MGKSKQLRGYVDARLALVFDTLTTVSKQTAELADLQASALKQTCGRLEALEHVVDLQQDLGGARTAKRLNTLEERLQRIEPDAPQRPPAIASAPPSDSAPRDLVQNALSSGRALTMPEIMELTGVPAVLVEASIKSFGTRIEQFVKRLDTYYRWVGETSGEPGERPAGDVDCDPKAGRWALIPHVTTEARDAIKDLNCTPEEPFLIFNKTTGNYESFDGTTWKNANDSWLRLAKRERYGVDGVDYLDTPNGRVKLHEKRRYTYGPISDPTENVATIVALYSHEREVELQADIPGQKGVRWRRGAAEVARMPFEPAMHVGDCFRGRKDVVIPTNGPEGLVMRPADRGYTCQVDQITDTHVCWSAIGRDARGSWVLSWDWTEEYERVGRGPRATRPRTSKLEDQLIWILSKFLGEVEESEGAVDVLRRITDELRARRQEETTERERCARIVSEAFPPFPADPEMTKLRGLLLRAINHG